MSNNSSSDSNFELNKQFETEIKKIESEDSIDIKKIYQAIFRRKKLFAVTTGTILVLTGVFNFYNRIFNPVYKGTFTILISDPINETSNNNLSNASLALFEDLANNNNSISDFPTLVEFLKNPILLKPVTKKYDISNKSLANMIKITNESREKKAAKGLLTVSLEIGNFRKGENILNELNQIYIKSSLDQRKKQIEDGIKFLDSQAPVFKEKSMQAQSKLATFREQNLIIKPFLKGDTLKNQERLLEEQLFILKSKRTELFELKNVIKEGKIIALGLKGQIGDDSQALTFFNIDQTLLEEFNKVLTALSEAQTKYTSSSKIVKGLFAKIEKIKPLILKNQLKAVDATIELNKTKIINLEKRIVDLETIFRTQPDIIKNFNNLQQEVQFAEESLQALRAAKSRFQLQMAQNTSPWSTIVPPEMSKRPIKPSIPKNLILGFFVGISAGMVAALIRDKLDYVFHNVDEVFEEIKVPSLGHIPYTEIFNEQTNSIKELLFNTKDLQKIDANDRYQRFFYQEAFRNIFTSIRFLNTEGKIKSIVVTSSIPSEGKSLTNILLAKTISEIGQRVLLVDADLRKPQLHKRLGMNNIVGLSNLIIDDEIDILGTIQSVPKMDNLKVLTAGVNPPDPTRLLSSNRAKNVMKELSESGEFDLIIYDTPPILLIADAALTSQNTDGMILLVSINKVERNLPKKALKRINDSGSKLLGVVTNTRNEDKYNKEFNSYADYANYASVNPSQENEISNTSNQAEDLSSVKEETKLENKLKVSINRVIKSTSHQLNKLIAWIEK